MDVNQKSDLMKILMRTVPLAEPAKMKAFLAECVSDEAKKAKIEAKIDAPDFTVKAVIPEIIKYWSKEKGLSANANGMCDILKKLKLFAPGGN